MIPKWAVEAAARRLRDGDTIPTAATSGHVPAQSRGQVIEEYAKAFGVSRATVYRRLQQLEGRRPGLRISKDERRWASELAGYVHATMNKKGIAVGTESAIRELERMGRIPTGAWRRQRADNVLRALGLTKRHMRKPRPCVRLSAPGPNTWHQVDFTVSAMFYLENLGKGSRIQGVKGSRVRIESEFQKKKSERTKVMIGCCTDVFSRCMYARAYEAKGESTELVVKFLHDAWTDRGDPGFPFHGVPWNVYSDQGPGLKAGPVQTLLDHLFVDWTGHRAKNPRATGAVERRFLDTARFEALMRGRLACQHQVTLKEFDSWLYEMCVDLNNRRHPVFKDKSRFEVWQTIQEDDIRQCPEWSVFVNLTAVGEMRRKVTPYMTISLSGTEYFLGVPDLVGEVVEVYLSADKKVWVRFEDRVYGPLADSVPVNILGADVRQAGLTASEKNIKEAVAAARRIGVRKVDLAYVRGEDSGIWVPRKGRRLEHKPELKDSRIQGSEGPSEFTEVWQAKNWLVQHGMDIAGMNPSEREVLDDALHELLERDGSIGVVQLKEVAEAVAAVTAEVVGDTIPTAATSGHVPAREGRSTSEELIEDDYLPD